MELSEEREFLKNNHRGCLVTRKKDGSLQMTLVSPVLGADREVIITARDTPTRFKILGATHKFLCWFMTSRSMAPTSIQFDGKAEVIEHLQAMDIVLDWHWQIRGEPKSWQEIREKTLAEGRIAIRLAIEKVGPQQKR